jgi:hypothetical protein
MSVRNLSAADGPPRDRSVDGTPTDRGLGTQPSKQEVRLRSSGANSAGPPVTWHPPAPRSGLAGYWDRFVGPGMTAIESWILLVGGLTVAALSLAVFWTGKDQDFAAWQVVILGLIAFDIAGGVIDNATSAAKRWYHRPGVGTRQHLGFIALHIVYLAYVSVVFVERPWWYFGVFTALLMLCAVIVEAVPLFVQRPVAMALYAASIAISMLGFAAAPGLEWFVPLLFLKLLIGHLLREAPFRPGDERLTLS